MSTMPDHLRPIMVEIPVTWTAEQALAVWEMLDELRRKSGPVTAANCKICWPSSSDAQASTTVTRVLGLSTSNHPSSSVWTPDRNDYPVVRSRRPSRRPDLRLPTLSRAAAVQDARRASPKAARSVLDGCEHDGSVIAETGDDATTGCHRRIKTRRLDADLRRR
jgi:hypothetical protein